MTTTTLPAIASPKWRTEDWVAVYLGFLVIALALWAFGSKAIDLGQLAPSFRWTTDAQIAARSENWSRALDGVAKGGELKAALEKGERKAIEKAAGELAKAAGRNTVQARWARRSAATPPRARARCSRLPT